ncbi:ubiquinol-cytochrome c reductase core subunit 1 [Mucor velutinosus]|uniref:Ubiquinol-cytochrome c reductase core subunit 1 n=1 Tax=Mucor velutinosus TaxID=708070 RepID=A0AAN7I297_9FUNG|nr:ubiquinol-cytochrome c reductase core subunit 1 [Mucor velutinosus]
MATTTDLSWVTVLSRGLSKKVINAPQQRAKDDHFKLIPEVMFEHEDLKAEVLTRKATAILQQALTPGSVLFTFPNKLFVHRTTAYRLIQEQIAASVQFRPLSLYHQKSTGDLLVEAKFDSPEDAKRAINNGITHGDVVYKATAVKDNSEGKLTHVQMTIVRMPNMTTFLEDLQRSLKYYGKLYQIKKYTVDGFFEGHVSFLIDTSVKYTDAEGHSYDVQPLSRMLYLSAWDVYVPATYRGAPPVCHFCRQSGHIRAACPILAKRKCFKCHKLGHTVKFCREEEKPFDEAIAEYESSQRDHTDSYSVTPIDKDNEKEKGHRASPAINGILAQQLPSQPTTTDKLAGKTTELKSSQISTWFSADDSQTWDQSPDVMEVDPQTLQRSPNGSDASKHAPLASSFHMHLDPKLSADNVSSPNDFQTDVPSLRRHSMSSTSMSQPTVYQDAHRA